MIVSSFFEFLHDVLRSMVLRVSLVVCCDKARGQGRQSRGGRDGAPIKHKVGVKTSRDERSFLPKCVRACSFVSLWIAQTKDYPPSLYWCVGNTRWWHFHELFVQLLNSLVVEFLLRAAIVVDKPVNTSCRMESKVGSIMASLFSLVLLPFTSKDGLLPRFG